MLAAALRAEVAAYIEAHCHLVGEVGRRLVVRNGYRAEREIPTAAGAVKVRQPRVNDERIDEETGERVRISSEILPAWCRRSPQVSEVMPLLYLHGPSPPTSRHRWSSSSAPATGCRRRRPPGSPSSGRTT
jgi:putative transposase